MRPIAARFLSLACIVLAGIACPRNPCLGDDRPDLLINDFEAADYGDWTAEGDALGSGPAAGTLTGQMPVAGFEGERLVNTFHQGDQATGTLTSPPVRVERSCINFLIGGGAHPGETCINLLHEGEVVRTATGPNTTPGGSEALDWHTWDVSDLPGAEVTFQIVDRHTGGWGHINIDQIVQSDRRFQQAPASHALAVTHRYLHLPVRTGAAKRRVRIDLDGRTLREFEIELVPTAEADLVAFTDLEPWRGHTIQLHVDKLPADSTVLDELIQSDDVPSAAELYSERFRPQFHFTSRRGWLNDPNGLVYHDGEWHLFYQHNPYGWNWGNMHWGHAVSADLFHWNEIGEAIYPHRFGDWAFSGSAVVDHRNTSGMQAGDEPVLAAFYTSTGRGECVVFSNDRGRTWTEYEGNPVVRHQGRDPKVIWHEPSRRWVMAVYTEPDGQRQIAFHTSGNLKDWEFASRIDGFFECPDLFELSLEGDPSITKWVLYAADGRYMLGDFDGREYQLESGKHQLWHGNFYAAQTYDNAPHGRRVQIGWGQGITFPGMPFNQQMTVPVELTLRNTEDGPRMFAEPVAELTELHQSTMDLSNLRLQDDAHTFEQATGGLFDLELDVDLGDCRRFGVRIGDESVEIDSQAEQRTLHCGDIAVPLGSGNQMHLRILVDRGSLEVFVNHGEQAVSAAAKVPADHPPLELFAEGGDVSVSAGGIRFVKSAWPQ